MQKLIPFHSDENIYGSQIKQPYGLPLAISVLSARARVCVWLRKGSVWERKRVHTTDFLWPHNQFIYLLYSSAPMSSSVPWRGCTFKGNFDKTDPPQFPASVCSPYIFLFCSSLVSSLPPDKGRLKEQSWLLLQPHLSQQEGGSKHMWTKTQKWEGGIKCVIAQVWLCTSTSDSVCVSTVNVSMCYSTYAYII